MNEELSDKAREQFEIRKDRLLQETKKDIDMLVDQYALAYSTKDKEMKFMARYYDTVSEMKEKIITYDPRFFSFIMDSKKLSSQEKLAIYNKKKEFLDTLTDDGLNNYLANPNNFRDNPELLFSVKAEKIIREYFEKVSGTSFDKFEAQCAKLESSFIIMYAEYKQRKSPVLSEKTNFDPKKEIQAMYKQLNKNDGLKEQKKEQIKEQLIKYFTEQSKEQRSFYNVEDSKIFKKFHVTNMTEAFEKKTEKLPLNLENLETNVLETKKNKLEMELKQALKKERKPHKDLPQSRFISSIEPKKRNKLEELTFLREELKVRKQVKQAEKHFGIKWKKIFGEETPQVKREFHDLLRSEDSLVTAVKIVQQHFPSTYEPEKTKIVQQSLQAEPSAILDNSEKNKPEKTIISLGEKLQATNSAKIIQRKDGLAEMDDKVNSLLDNTKSFSEAVEKLPRTKPTSQAQPSSLRSILERLPGIRRIAPVKQAKKVGERNQTNIYLHEFDQQRKFSAAQSNLLNSSSLKKQPSTVSRKVH